MRILGSQLKPGPVRALANLLHVASGRSDVAHTPRGVIHFRSQMQLETLLQQRQEEKKNARTLVAHPPGPPLSSPQGEIKLVMLKQGARINWSKALLKYTINLPKSFYHLG